MKTLFNSIQKTLDSELAAVKLFIIRYGLNVDGAELSRKIGGYPEMFRTKRSIKNTGLQNGRLVDREQRDIPWIPEEIFITVNGRESVVKTNYNPGSPFQLGFIKDRMTVHAPELDIQIPCRLSQRHGMSEQRIDGFPINQYIDIIGSDRLAVLGFDGCAGWFHGTQCLFCDSCASRPGEIKARPTLNDLHTQFSDDVTAWLNHAEPRFFKGLAKAYRQTLDNKQFGPHCHLLVLAGNLMDMNSAWEYILRLARVLSNEKPLSQIDSYVNMLPPIKTDYLENAKKIGFSNLITNLEVYGEKFFKAICRGKNDLIPYDLFLKRMQDAVVVFGRGQVRCGFVLGAQPVDILKNGVIHLAEAGIVSDYSLFTPKRGTPWEKREQPDLLEVAGFSRFLSDTYRQFNFKPLYCSMSSRSSIMNECYEACV